MRKYGLVVLATASLITPLVFGVDPPEPSWKVEKLSLIQVKEGVRRLSASLVRVPDSRRVELSGDVAAQGIQNSFVWKDRLVLFGEAERASAVEIFDLTAKTKLDWFVCYEPRRVSGNWIVYKEHYFTAAQGPVAPHEVLLLYDLDRSPIENRASKAVGPRIPAPVPIEPGDNVVEVGIPIFPENNARLQSYEIRVEKQAPGRSISLQAVTLLPSKRLVFPCTEMWPGLGRTGARQYLAVVDLSRGLDQTRSFIVELPKVGDDVAVIDKIEAEPPNAVRLVFPKGRYGTESLVIGLPEF